MAHCYIDFFSYGIVSLARASGVVLQLPRLYVIIVRTGFQPFGCNVANG